MKHCKINIERRNRVFETLGMALIVAAVVGKFIDDKLSMGLFMALLLAGVWLLLIGVCDDQ